MLSRNLAKLLSPLRKAIALFGILCLTLRFLLTVKAQILQSSQLTEHGILRHLKRILQGFAVLVMDAMRPRFAAQEINRVHDVPGSKSLFFYKHPMHR